MHDELAHFRHAGLSAFETLRAATSDAARSVGQTETWGAVTAGARADLILVPGNPLEDLGRLRAPSGAMVRGTWLSAGVLKQRLAEIRASYGN